MLNQKKIDMRMTFEKTIDSLQKINIKSRAQEQGYAITMQSVEYFDIRFLIQKDSRTHRIVEALKGLCCGFQQIIFNSFNTEYQKHFSESLVTN